LYNNKSAEEKITDLYPPIINWIKNNSKADTAKLNLD